MMIKVLLGSLLFVCLSTATVLKGHQREIIEGCKSENEMWGIDDPTKFCFCIGGNQAIVESCAPNTFFVKNATISGCVPFSEVNDNCVYHQQVQPCVGDVAKQPQTHQDPTKFYLCTGEGATPIVMSCIGEKAFLKEKGYLGCFEWPKWRSIRNCPMDE